MKKFTLLVLIFCTCFFSGCKKFTPSFEYTGFPEFVRNDTVSYDILATGLEIIYPIQTFVIDSVLLVVDMVGTDHFVKIYNEKGEFLKNMVRKGRGPGEIQEFRRFYLNRKNKTISFYDRQKIIEYDIAKVLEESPEYFSVIILPESDKTNGGFESNALKIDNEKIFWVGMSTEKRFAITQEGQTEIYNKYPDFTSDPDINAAIANYGETITFSKNYDRFAKGTYIGGILEIFEINGTIITPKEPLYIYEPITSDVRGSGKNITWGDETIIGFESLDCTDKYIYSLLNGVEGIKLKEPDFDDPPFANRISVFDWNGNPVRSINLDKGLMTVAVKDDNTIYSVAFNEGYSLIKIEI